jgi:hypothetical protein
MGQATEGGCEAGDWLDECRTTRKLHAEDLHELVANEVKLGTKYLLPSAFNHSTLSRYNNAETCEERELSTRAG